MELPALADAFAADDGLLLATLRLRVGGAAAEDGADAASFFDRLPAVALWRACGTALEQLAPTPAADGAADAAVPNGHAPTEATAAAGETASARLELIEASAAMLLGETVGGRARSPSTAAEEARGAASTGFSLARARRARCSGARSRRRSRPVSGGRRSALSVSSRTCLSSSLDIWRAPPRPRRRRLAAARPAQPAFPRRDAGHGTTGERNPHVRRRRHTAAATAAAAAAAAASAADALGGALGELLPSFAPNFAAHSRARATTAAAAVRRSSRHFASPPRCCWGCSNAYPRRCAFPSTSAPTPSSLLVRNSPRSLPRSPRDHSGRRAAPPAREGRVPLTAISAPPVRWRPAGDAAFASVVNADATGALDRLRGRWSHLSSRRRRKWSGRRCGLN